MLISTLCFGALVVAFCSFADRLGYRLGLIDHPDGVRKRHARPTPLVGGLALMVPMLVIAAREAYLHPGLDEIFLVLGAAGLGFMALGLFDDRHQATPLVRLIVSTLLCGVLLAAVPVLQLDVLVLGPFSLALGLFALPFTVLCLLGLQNAINMADGLNGLVIGLAIFWTSCLLLYAPAPLVPYLSLLLLGLFILLPYNLMGYLFLGDAGSYSLGVVLGLLMIYVYHTSAAPLPMLTVVLWLLVPVLDCLRVVLSRLLAGRSPLMADSNHFHHRLARHWRWPVSVLIYLAIATVPGFVAALWPGQTVLMLVVAVLAYGTVVWHTRSRFFVAVDRRDVTAF